MCVLPRAMNSRSETYASLRTFLFFLLMGRLRLGRKRFIPGTKNPSPKINCVFNGWWKSKDGAIRFDCV